ncbi:MAG: TonB-dependent receptor plug domain-containing protein [Steroidobacteraceae bacterium]
MSIALALVLAAASAADPDDESQLDEIVVTATRVPTMVRDSPLRIEAVPAEEIEENLTIQPGNVTALLKELPGVRMQSSAPGLGGATMQLRGLPGRHTLLLNDGLPLIGAEPNAFGLLQTPPLDLARAEVIKGTVSALYGGSSLGGVLNLVSQTADAEPGVLANVTSRGGEDLATFLTGHLNAHWSGTLAAGAHWQARKDDDDDGWAELAGYRRYTLRPRLWWDDRSGHSLFLTLGAVDEDRTGGTVPGRTLPGGNAFAESLTTRRYDAGGVFTWTLTGNTSFTARASYTSDRQDRIFGPQRVPSTAETAYLEAAWNGTTGTHRWLLGLAAKHEELSAPAVSGIDYRYETPGVFAQDDWALAPWLTFSGSLRVDRQNDFGTFLSPRLSALFRQPASDWSLRASVGGGFALPTPFVDEIDDTGLGVLLPLTGLHAERARTVSLDAKWADEGWDLNASVFYAEIRQPLQALPAPGNRIQLVNAALPLRAPGAEALIGYVRGPLHMIASWSYLDVTEADDTGIRGRAARVPRETASLDGILEDEKRGRIGLELDYVGPQELADDPYRSTSPGYFQLNALAEVRFGHVAIFFNAINLTDRRQGDFDPLLRTTRGLGGNPITEVWAPLVGRTFNLGIRAEL